MILKEMASQKGQLRLFEPEDRPSAGNARKTFQRARSKQLAELFQAGFSVHHAGLLRSDRWKSFLSPEIYLRLLACRKGFL
ncbi:activating signal cointegrator 1 complex subunit 3-like [Lycorma delicatula]|uniref:activating signal cointegrator 1 complex subunit 3-like n=1 Tax=Lycorma delicatula TaxID=130591 RepID=UPI003F5198F1